MQAINLCEMGGRVRSQRAYLGLTREMLAEKLGVTPKFCSDIELGQKGMSIQTLSNLSQILKVSTDYLLFGANAQGDFYPLLEMLKKCPEEKLPYAEEILRTFLTAIN